MLFIIIIPCPTAGDKLPLRMRWLGLLLPRGPNANWELRILHWIASQVLYTWFVFGTNRSPKEKRLLSTLQVSSVSCTYPTNDKQHKKIQPNRCSHTEIGEHTFLKFVFIFIMKDKDDLNEQLKRYGINEQLSTRRNGIESSLILGTL